MWWLGSRRKVLSQSYKLRHQLACSGLFSSIHAWRSVKALSVSPCSALVDLKSVVAPRHTSVVSGTTSSASSSTHSARPARQAPLRSLQSFSKTVISVRSALASPLPVFVSCGQNWSTRRIHTNTRSVCEVSVFVPTATNPTMWTVDGVVQDGMLTAKDMLTSNPPGAYTTARTVDGGTFERCVSPLHPPT